MVFVFLTPQPNNYSEMLGIQVNIDLISTLNSISKGKNVATYQTCLDKLMIATYLVRGKVQVILSNGEMKEVTDEDTLEDIMELEKSAIEEAFNTPTIDLKAKTNINEIKVNAMDFYQAIYCDDNADTIEDSMVEAIKQTKTEEVGVEVSNELDIVNKIIEDYEVEGKISEIFLYTKYKKGPSVYFTLGQRVYSGITNMYISVLFYTNIYDYKRQTRALVCYVTLGMIYI